MNLNLIEPYEQRSADNENFVENFAQDLVPPIHNNSHRRKNNTNQNKTPISPRPRSTRIKNLTYGNLNVSNIIVLFREILS